MFNEIDTDNVDFWRPGHFRVFISHISKHRIPASKLQNSFIPHHISSFVAHNDIQPTREWENEILKALRTADALVALLHKGFHESSWTDHEIGFAIGRDLLPVSVSFGTTPYGFIGRYQAIQGMGLSYDQLAEKLFKIFLTHPQTKRRMTEALVHKFINSNSYESAKENMTLLESVEYWDDTLSKKIRNAVKENRQISDSWGVPDRVKSLINEWERKSIPF